MHANILQVQDVVHILMPNIIELLGVLIPNVRRRKAYKGNIKKKSAKFLEWKDDKKKRTNFTL